MLLRSVTLISAMAFATTAAAQSQYSSSLSTKLVDEAAAPTAQVPELELTAFCDPEREPGSKACKFQWRSALLQSAQFLALQHTMNASTYNGTLEGKFFDDWMTSVGRYRFTRWHDDDPFIVDYIGHPMMGAVTGFIQIQNNPVGTRQRIGKNSRYWKSRAKALAWSSVYAAQWELGPISETSIGNLGSFNYYSESSGHLTNGTGLTDLVATPVAGTIWLIGEDLIDRFMIEKLERRSRNRAYLASISILNPTRSLANLLRMKTPWYRDGRRAR